MWQCLRGLRGGAGITSHRWTSVSQLSQELAVKSIRDEITWPPYASLDQHLDYALENNSSVTPTS
jgi:hypothetical protein